MLIITFIVMICLPFIKMAAVVQSGPDKNYLHINNNISSIDIILLSVNTVLLLLQLFKKNFLVLTDSFKT